jgi:hypothetical protein
MSAVRSPSLLARTVLTVSEVYCAGRRVALVGPGGTALAADLLAAGARSVHHYATDAERSARQAQTDRTLLVRELPAGDFDVREGAFDLVVVEDLSLLGDVPAWLGRFRRLVGASGIFVAGAPRADGVSHDSRAFGVHELDELVSVQFAWIDLRGLAAFHGALVAPVGAQGSIADFVLHPLGDGRAAVEQLVVIASQKPRAPEPTMLLEVEASPEARAEARLMSREPSNDAPGRVAAEALQAEHARTVARLAEERADLLDTIARREDALRAAESEGDRLRLEVDELTAHLDRALAGAVPAHLARLEALADKDRPRVVEAPLAVAERARFEAELAAADAARAEADAACLDAEARLGRSEELRKRTERELEVTRDGLRESVAHATSLEGELGRFVAASGAEIEGLEARLRTFARERRVADEDARAIVRFLAADRQRSRGGQPVAGAASEVSPGGDEADLVRKLLGERARADLLALEVQALRARIARIVDAADDAAASSVDTGAAEPRLADVSPPSAVSSRPAVPGPHSDDG